MRHVEFDTDSMTRLEILSVLTERLTDLRVAGIGYEHHKVLERRVRVCEGLVFALRERERQDSFWRLP